MALLSYWLPSLQRLHGSSSSNVSSFIESFASTVDACLDVANDGGVGGGDGGATKRRFFILASDFVSSFKSSSDLRFFVDTAAPSDDG